jgi:hypothetical protein
MSAISILEQEGIVSLAAGMAGITTTASIARTTARQTTGLTPATTERLPIRISPSRGFRELWLAHLAGSLGRIGDQQNVNSAGWAGHSPGVPARTANGRTFNSNLIS